MTGPIPRERAQMNARGTLNHCVEGPLIASSHDVTRTEFRSIVPQSASTLATVLLPPELLLKSRSSFTSPPAASPCSNSVQPSAMNTLARNSQTLLIGSTSTSGALGNADLIAVNVAVPPFST